MNTELQIFKNEEFGEVRTIEKQITNKYLGFFYFLEWDNRIKIGCSTKPYTRLMSLKRTAEKYGNVQTGRFALSQSHTNYTENEQILHKRFSNKRVVGSELFEMTLEEAIEMTPEYICYKDETEKFERKANAFLDSMKSFMLGGNTK